MTKRKRRGGARAQSLPTTQAGSPGATTQSITDGMKSAVEAGSKTCNAKRKRISSGVLRCTTTALKTRGPTTRSKSRASGGLSGAQSMDMTEDKSAHSPASVSMAGTTSDDTYSIEGNEKRFSTPESTLYSDDVFQLSFPSSDEDDDFLLPLDVIMGLAPMPVRQSPKKNHKPSQLSPSEIPAKKTKVM